jgi:hypothetical protein
MFDSEKISFGLVHEGEQWMLAEMSLHKDQWTLRSSQVGALTDFVSIIGEKPVIAVLKSTRVFSNVLSFPEVMTDEEIQVSFAQQASSVLPVPVEELLYELEILRGGSDDKAYVFVSGVEKSQLAQYRQTLLEVGLKNVAFVSEGFALSQAMPIRASKYPATMMIHALKESYIVLSMFHGYLFDALHVKDLPTEVVAAHQAYVQVLNALPTHIVLSGSSERFAALSSANFEPMAPPFVQAELDFFPGDSVPQGGLMLAVGAAMSSEQCRKKDSVHLMNLLE